MDALKMAAGSRAESARGSSGTTEFRSDEISLAPRMKAVLAALLEALEYAEDLGGSPWDFAIEISSMRRLKLSNSDLRWLVARGLVKHALEVTPPRDSVRSFRRPPRPAFGKKSCFVLTTVGAELARGCRPSIELLAAKNSRAAPDIPLPVSPPRPAAPKWDRDRRELRVGLIVVKQFKLPSAGQEAILTAFEETSWPPRIDDPVSLRDGSMRNGRLQETIRLLNKNQKRSLVRFAGDSNGQCVCWEFCDESAAPREF
jgi:hypothetical protein